MGGHPKGLTTLFFTELWERFSYYGMRAILTLFMVGKVADGGLGLDVATAAAIYGFYTAAVFFMGIPGGWIADRLLGQRNAVLYGGILIAMGHYSLAIDSRPTFYAGLVLIVLGTGLLKPNISAIVGQLYSADDNRRDAGFSIFYMGINMGAFFAPLVCGTLAERVGWHWGFGAAGVGMTLGLIQYVLGGSRLGDAGILRGKPKDAGLLWGKLALGVFALAAVFYPSGTIGTTCCWPELSVFSGRCCAREGIRSRESVSGRSSLSLYSPCCSGRVSSRRDRVSRCSPRTSPRIPFSAGSFRRATTNPSIRSGFLFWPRSLPGYGSDGAKGSRRAPRSSCSATH